MTGAVKLSKATAISRERARVEPILEGSMGLSMRCFRIRLRHILLGSRDGVQQTIHQLHHLGYVEHLHWSQLITVPPSGIVITPHQGEFMSYLVRMRMLD